MVLTREANERLCRVGPGTPMGELMRRYWQPIAPAARLRENPVRQVRILGEDLVLFRDRGGKLGLIADKCAHRSAGMRFGIPEANGLRCCYHGWLFNAEGQCIETPLEPPESTFKDRVAITAYPVQELGGLIFAYLGPEPVPLLPRWDIFVWPNAIRQVGVTILPCNWLQCQENALDPAHGIYLHGHFFRYTLERLGLLDERAADTTTHRAFTGARPDPFTLEFQVSEHGIRKFQKYSQALGARRDSVREAKYMLFPHATIGAEGGIRSESQFRVPMDDTHTYHITYQVYRAPEGIEAPEQDVIPWFDVPIADERGEPILDYVLAQDMAAWWTQGEITDRSHEKLGTTDSGIIMFRRLLDQQIRRVERGEDPMNVIRDPELNDIINLTPPDRTELVVRAGAYRSQYHKGYAVDDADRYGPAIDLVKELMRRIEERMATPASAGGSFE
ncbi:MAG TPA: Rieske 2Fe-2S domain-containing protein [Chloroflexota bacterium]|nr:Rieske 2Fe-2S domain-containing protein [Chloroflexota bacterium]